MLDKVTELDKNFKRSERPYSLTAETKNKKEIIILKTKLQKAL